MSSTSGAVGSRVPQLEGAGKVSGAIRYTHDIALPGMLFAAVLRSPHPHARIVSIDVAPALAVEGVCDAVVATDFPDRKYINLGPAYADRYPMARGVVRFVGEEVAAVAASSPEAARAGIEAIRVVFDPLPAAVTVDEALAPGAPQVHPDKPGLGPNLAQAVDVRFGDVDAAMASAHLVVRGTFEHGIVWPVCLETNAAVAAFDASRGLLEVWAGTQAPFFVRKELAQVLDMDAASIQVRTVAIGGGFGGKSQSPEQIAIAAMLAVRTGKPVKLVLSRQEEYLAGKNDHGKTIRLATAVDSEGNILARTVEAFVDNGAYTHMGPAYVSAVRQRVTSLYRVAAAAVKIGLVYTHKVPGGSYRGMGAPGIIWAIETQVDQIAEQLGLDPVAYRLRIANRPGDTTPLAWHYTTCGLSECLQRAADRIGWREKKGKLPPMSGIGIAAMVHPSGSVLYAEGNFSNVSVELQPDGRVLVCTQTADAGTGQNTLLAQFVAQTLAIAVERVSVLHMDTERSPDDLGSAASRVTFVTGQAAIDAARKFVQVVCERIAADLGRAVDEVRYALGRFQAPSLAPEGIGWDDVAERFGTLRAEGHYAIDLPRPDAKTGYGQYAATYGFGAQAAQVEVDEATGQVRVVRIVSVQDVGKAINPTALEGQTYGGIMQGIGMALSEEVIFDRGQPVNTSLFNYRVPRIAELPQIDVEFVETNDPQGPFGAKGAGEPTINATLGAIANAVADAVGVRFMRLPITPERVLEALARKRGTAAPSLKPHKRPYNAEVALVRAMYPRIVFPAMQALSASLSRPRRRVSTFDVVRATSADTVSELLAEDGAGNRILGGGTDLLPGIRQGVYGPRLLVDASALPSLRALVVSPQKVRLGAAVRLTELAQSAALRPMLPGLCAGVELIATRQVRNRATVAGDLCQQNRCWFFRSARPCYRFAGPTAPCYAVCGDNRHHSILGAGRCAAPCVSDLAPMLSALRAEVVATGRRAERRVPVAMLYRWAGQTVLAPDEWITSIEWVPQPGAAFHFAKYMRWKGDFAEASVAAYLQGTRRRLTAAGLALGGVAPGPHVPRKAEATLLGGPLTRERINASAAAVVEGALPMKDNAYKAGLAIAQARKAIEFAIDDLAP